MRFMNNAGGRAALISTTGWKQSVKSCMQGGEEMKHLLEVGLVEGTATGLI